MGMTGETGNGEGVCPYLGHAEDADTALAYPTRWNCCYHARPAGPANLAYQRNFCLRAEHIRCSVYPTDGRAPLPPGVRYSKKRREDPASPWKEQIFLFRLALALTFLMVAAMIYAQGRQGKSVPGKGEVPTGQASLPAAASLGSPGVTGAATALMTGPTVSSDTPTAGLPAPGGVAHLLETPIPPEGLVIHRVAGGESLDSLARRYGTSVEAIVAVNYRLSSPIRADWVLVIPAQRMDVSGLPAFTVYQAMGDTRLDTLAWKYSVTAEELMYYNGLEQDEPIGLGEYVLIPHTE